MAYISQRGAYWHWRAEVRRRGYGPVYRSSFDTNLNPEILLVKLR
ncbi:hypothetical protein [Paraburkholderia susongensis]|uniref:Uncharacterized protein n=1 Tax=Paraburkholderia susongensis TaxID=1515439 RepID=A0A1X7K753_9BURK|nr:hypothetical protein [Paraburkholderia susongensis]SMG36528.1 hypothetical protein SAMN06265784_103406 [Paraburkholderia susongensis]